MPRSLLSRSLEPLVAVSWGVFLFWSVWLAVVWTLGINRQWLGLPIGGDSDWAGGVAGMVQDGPPPPNEGLRRAVLLLADHAELGWLALALIQVHLHVIGLHGVNTARVWLGVAVGGAFLLASVNRAFGIPFGRMHFTPLLGSQFFGVPVGWALLWPVLLIASREAVLRVRSRASHVASTLLAAAVVTLTFVNLHRVATELRWWWFWHTGDVLIGVATPWWAGVSCFAVAAGLLFLMRESSVAGAAARRSIKPLIVIVLLNAAAILARAVR